MSKIHLGKYNTIREQVAIIAPKTRLGKWTVMIIIIFLFSFLTVGFLIKSGQELDAIAFGGKDLAIETSVLLMGISGMISFFTGVFSIVKYKERSILVFTATSIGLYIFIVIISELLK